MRAVQDFESESQELKHLQVLYQELVALRKQIQQEGEEPPALLSDVHDDFRQSAMNLLHYLSLRRHDLRSIQNRLTSAGLSSLGGSEPCVLSSLDRVINILRLLTHETMEEDQLQDSKLDFLMGQLTLEHHSNTLLGAKNSDRAARIMVTMPSEAAQDYALIKDLLQSGMDCMRINCAHDGPEEWLRMVEHLRRAEKAVGKSCRIAMDLAGPKLRTGRVQSGPEVIKVRPKRNDYGWVVGNARIWMSSAQWPRPAPSAANIEITADAAWLARLKTEDVIEFRDARGAKRCWHVVEVSRSGVWLEGRDTSYVANGQLLTLSRDKSTALVGGVAAKQQGIMLKLGDKLIVTAEDIAGTPATHDSSGQVLSPAMIGCTLPECIPQVRQGESIWFDDGKIGGIVEVARADRLEVKITRVRAQGRQLRADKGINLPESHLSIPSLTEKDRRDVVFVAKHADMVALSFVNEVDDVEQLKQLLNQLGERKPGIVLKVETRRGFVNLPQLLLSVMSWPSSGVMIARGDLAVECGFERLAEVQEEILWLCEAAHVPVIWATQVLESLAKEGLPSRAEITDAAMGHRAECVMLNKGPHIVMAVKALSDILQRMQTHQSKKRPMMRKLQVAMFR